MNKDNKSIYKHESTSQPRIEIDKVLYKEYTKMLKSINKNIMIYNKLLFERAVRAELEAFNNLTPEKKQEILISDIQN